MSLGLHLLNEPGLVADKGLGLIVDHARLLHLTLRRLRGKTPAPVIEPDRDDRRFAADGWRDRLPFDLVKQSYLLVSRALREAAAEVGGLDPDTARKAAFHLRRLIDAAAPSNFLPTNPEALQAAWESGGESLIRGLDNLLSDLEAGQGSLRLRITDETAFRLGENVAVTPGKVIFQNDLMQLIQYQPTTAKVFRRPLLIVPPWINKFYVLDLQPRNSFLRWAVAQGHTVFVVSWVNPDGRLRNKRFDDYMLEGPLAALDAIEKATSARTVNVVGYCIGGTLLACALAYMAAKGDRRVRSATFLTTLVDFTEPGDLKVFIDRRQLANLDRGMARKGYLDGRQMSHVFTLLRANDLIWSTVVRRYLLGQKPAAFDLLYWNADSTRMPAMMHGFYLRRMYLENKLAEPGGIVLDGVPIDLRKIEVPTYLVATEEDHIVPWRGAFAATGLYKGPIRFVLAASGHIAGVVNPPDRRKYWHWTNPSPAATPDDWLKGATRIDGSWWPDWAAWLAGQGGAKVTARIPGTGGLAAIEDAPGSYVKVRAED